MKNRYVIKKIIFNILALFLGLNFILTIVGNCVMNRDNVTSAQSTSEKITKNIVINNTSIGSDFITKNNNDDNRSIDASNDIRSLSYNTQYITNNLISTSVNKIPWVVPASPYTINASGWSNLSNVTLYYRYSADNFSTYCTDLMLRDVFREGVDTTVFDYPNSIKVIGSVGYAIAYKDNSLVLINVLDSSTLTQLSYKIDTNYLYRVHDVAVSTNGNYAYTINYRTNPWICIWNVTNKTTSPVRLNQVQLSSFGKGMYLNLDITGNFLYATTTDYCCIYNITNKASGQIDLVSKFNTGIPSTSSRWHTYVMGNALYVFVNNQSSTVRGDGVYVYDISDKTSPVLVNDFNHTEQIREFREYYWHGFHYLIGFLQYKKNLYWTGALGLWNVSSGNVTHPDFIRQINTLEGDGTFTADAFDIHNGYVFAMRKNYNKTTYTGITAYSIKDINTIFKVDHINGTGFPNYLNLCHEVEFNQNGIDGTVYVVSQISDALTTIGPDWGNQTGSWTQFGIDYSSPWSWSFNFPNGTGYYEFYSIGKKNGETELPPDNADARCFYDQNNPPYEPSNPNPMNNSTDISSDITLGWNGGDLDSDDTITYDVYFGTTSTPPKATSNQSAMVYDPGILMCATTYYWKIIAWDNHNAYTIGPIWHFTTFQNSAPTAPTIDGPSSGNTGIRYNYTFVSHDPDNDSVFYEIDWGDGTVDDWYGPNESNQIITRSHQWTESGSYTIRARAKDVHGAIGAWGVLSVTMPTDQQIQSEQLQEISLIRLIKNNAR